MEIIKGGLSIDDRGSVTFVNDFDFKDVKRFYVVENHIAGYKRGWHGHKKEAKYVFVPRGTAIVGVVDLNETDTEYAKKNPRGVPNWTVLSAKKPQILYIPPNSANAFKTLTDDTQVIFYSTTTMEEAKNDDIRYPLNKWPFFEGVER